MGIDGLLRIMVLMGIAGLMVGCSLFTSHTIPDWVEGKSERYPDEKFLVGRGEAETRDVAEQRAYAAVARIFNAQVTSQMEDSEVYSQSESEGNTRTSRQVKLDHLTQVTSEKVLENVQVLDTWLRPADHRYFALAGLNREKAERMLVERISDYDKTILMHLEDGREGANALTRLRALKRALRDAQIRHVANADLQIIRMTGGGLPASHPAAAIRKEIDDFFLHDLHIDVRLTGDYQSQILQAVWEGLNREGLVPLGQDPNALLRQQADRTVSQFTADLLITGTAHLDDLQLFDPLFKYVRWCSDLQIIDPKTQRMIGAVSRSGREGHITLQEARVRATRAMQNAVSEEISQSLARFIYDDDLREPSFSSSCPPRKLNPVILK